MKEPQKYVFAEIHIDRIYLDRWKKVIRWQMRLEIYQAREDISQEPRRLAGKNMTIWEGPGSVVPVWVETVCEYLRETLEGQVVIVTKDKGAHADE
jgi:hypothetical protein